VICAIWWCACGDTVLYGAASAGPRVLWRQEFYGRVGQGDTTHDRLDPSRMSRSVSRVERRLQRIKGNVKQHRVSSRDWRISNITPDPVRSVQRLTLRPLHSCFAAECFENFCYISRFRFSRNKSIETLPDRFDNPCAFPFAKKLRD
jgi:hypothetical protein